mmetsp:Transcript_26191/g.30279  ORF Transcript_26191/g.30279 Transcript_26191/m.30279 type:complete len:84 (+) Transcript_26191:351-602(+)
MGINPLKPQESFREDSEFVQGSSSIVIMKALKYVGLSDDTLRRIEEDLKNADKSKPEQETEVSGASQEIAEMTEKIEEDRKYT